MTSPWVEAVCLLYFELAGLSYFGVARKSRPRAESVKI
jgi:hypothetical protein